MWLEPISSLFTAWLGVIACHRPRGSCILQRSHLPRWSHCLGRANWSDKWLNCICKQTRTRSERGAREHHAIRRSGCLCCRRLGIRAGHRHTSSRLAQGVQGLLRAHVAHALLVARRPDCLLQRPGREIQCVYLLLSGILYIGYPVAECLPVVLFTCFFFCYVSSMEK